MNREDLFWLAASTAILGLLLRSVAADRRDRQRLAGELQAARAVQQLLIGAGEVDSHTWTVDAQYLPAQEVGGDFYQLFPGEDGSLLLVTGDVSGKGLQAAMLVATAGHLSPYLDGREVSLDAGLPLGIAPGVDYSETPLDLDSGKLVFLSDGVVEAANAKGELFGFDRTREISGLAAKEIASAAKAWGQNDDFTVVTVRSAL